MEQGKQYLQLQVDRTIVSENFGQWVNDDCTKYFLNRIVEMLQKADSKTSSTNINAFGSDMARFLINKFIKEGEAAALQNILKLPKIMADEIRNRNQKGAK